MPPYQALQIPAGWNIEWNQLMDEDPSEENIHEFTGSSLWFASSPNRLRCIDVNWKPEGNIDGSFHLNVVNLVPQFNPRKNEMEYVGLWENPAFEFQTKNRLELVEKLEELLFLLKPYVDERILLKPGIVDEENEKLRLSLIHKGPTKESVVAIIKSNNTVLQNCLLDHPKIDIETLHMLREQCSTKALLNRVNQLLNSKKFRK